MRRALAAAIGMTLALSADGRAQTTEQCAAARDSIGLRASSSPCVSLAGFIALQAPAVRRWRDSAVTNSGRVASSIFSQRDLQSNRSQQAALGGSAAQGQAVPSVQPAAVAAGTVASLGTDAGSDAIAALTLNPIVLFLGNEANKKLAQASRFMDLTVFVPMSRLEDSDPATSDTNRTYYGGRLRLNFTGISEGSKVWARADTLALRWIGNRGRDQKRILELLGDAPDVVGCVRALMDSVTARPPVQERCGQPFELTVNMADALAMRSEMTKVRQEADARYFGADVRYDSGDPTLGAVANASGRFTYAGVAWGRRFGAGVNGAASGARLRLGARHAKLDAADTAEFAAEGGIGYELSRMIEDQELNIQGALEFREGNAPANLTDQFQTNFVMLRATMQIPVFAGNSLSLNVGIPIRGDVSRVLSVNFNWGLLLPDVVSR